MMGWDHIVVVGPWASRRKRVLAERARSRYWSLWLSLNRFWRSTTEGDPDGHVNVQRWEKDSRVALGELVPVISVKNPGAELSTYRKGIAYVRMCWEPRCWAEWKSTSKSSCAARTPNVAPLRTRSFSKPGGQFTPTSHSRCLVDKRASQCYL
jgi:hypothetical protein